MSDTTITGRLGVGTGPVLDDRVRGYFYNGSEMVAIIMKVAGDSGDINIDGAALVKHDKNYTATPMYAHTFQVYAEAGMNGLILGCNTYVGLDRSLPYAPTPAAVADGFVSFELGPLAPYSEKARFNNRGDLIVGWTLVRKVPVAAQTGDVVTVCTADLTPADVGKYVFWGDYELRGKDRHADRIVAVIDATHARVETSRLITDQAARICSPRFVLRNDGGLEIKNQTTTPTTRDDAGVLFVQDGALKYVGAAGTITTIAPA